MNPSDVSSNPFSSLSVERVDTGEEVEPTIKIGKPVGKGDKQTIPATVDFAGRKYEVTLGYNKQFATRPDEMEETLKAIVKALKEKDLIALVGKKIKTSTSEWKPKLKKTKGKGKKYTKIKNKKIKKAAEKIKPIFEERILGKTKEPSPTEREQQEEVEQGITPAATGPVKFPELPPGVEEPSGPKVKEPTSVSIKVSQKLPTSQKPFSKRVNSAWNKFADLAKKLSPSMKNRFRIDVRYGIRSELKTVEKKFDLTPGQKKKVDKEVQKQINKAFKKYTDHKKAVKSAEKGGIKMPPEDRFSLASIRRGLIKSMNGKNENLKILDKGDVKTIHQIVEKIKLKEPKVEERRQPSKPKTKKKSRSLVNLPVVDLTNESQQIAPESKKTTVAAKAAGLFPSAESQPSAAAPPPLAGAPPPPPGVSAEAAAAAAPLPPPLLLQ